MQSEWRETTLGEVLELKRGYDLPKTKRVLGEIPLISSAGVSDFHNEAKVNAPGVVTGRYGTIGEVFYSDKDFWPLNTTLYVRDFKGNDAKFIYHFLKTIDYLQYSDKAAVPGVNRNHLHLAKVSIPEDIKEQKAIAHILSSLDDKIELNRQMNATLETMAQALFKSWFVDFDPVLDNALAAGNPIPDELADKAAAREAMGDARKPLPEGIAALFPAAFVKTEEMGWIPEGWEVAAFAKIAKLNPDAWTKKNEPDNVNYVDLSNTKDGRILSVTPYPFSEAPSRARRILKTDDTIIGTVRPGNRSFAYVQQDGLTGSTGFAVMRPRKLFYRSFVYFGLTQDSVIDMFAHLADGAAYPAIRPEVVSSANVVLPFEDQLLKRFDDLAHPWLKKIGDNEQLSGHLAELRDSLLPKLLSGELRIPDAEKLIGEIL